MGPGRRAAAAGGMQARPPVASRAYPGNSHFILPST